MKFYKANTILEGIKDVEFLCEHCLHERGISNELLSSQELTYELAEDDYINDIVHNFDAGTFEIEVKCNNRFCHNKTTLESEATSVDFSRDIRFDF